MASNNVAVFGIYASSLHAEKAVDKLIESGFPSADISVLLADSAGTKEFAHEKDTKAPEGATASVTTGGIVGGALGVLAGIGALAIPGVGPLIATGPIMAGLAGLGIGGAVGGIVGALVGMGIPEYEAKRYEGHVKNGGTLMSVHCDTSDNISRAKDLLKATGATVLRPPAKRQATILLRRPRALHDPTKVASMDYRNLPREYTMKKYVLMVALAASAALAVPSFAQTSNGSSADNSTTNKSDSHLSATADAQKNDTTDLSLTRQIRRSVMADKSLSTYAHNVKIVAVAGKVTLNGPVRSESKKTTVQAKPCRLPVEIM